MLQNKKFWNLSQSNDGKNADLLLYGSIGSDEWWDDISDKAFKKEIDNLNVETINLYINSPGGSVVSAIAIANSLKNHSANVIAHIDGIAASAATIITSACDKVKMPRNALFMIHNPLTVSVGEKKDHEKTIEILDKMKNSIIETYLAKVNIERDFLSELMDKETWLDADEALEYGFIDEITEETIVKNIISNNLVVNGTIVNLSDFKNFKQHKTIFSSNQEKIKNQNTKSKEEIMPEKIKNLTLEEIKNDFPALYEEIKNEGIIAERERIQKIENLAIQNEELVNDAKFENVITAEALAINFLEIENKRKKSKFENIKNETNETKIENIIEESKVDKDEELAIKISNQAKKGSVQ